MSGLTLQLNNLYIHHYPYLLKFSKKITQQVNRNRHIKTDYKDFPNQAYIKIIDKINKNNWKIVNHNITGLTLTIIRNLIIDENKQNKNNYGMFDSFNPEIEKILQDKIIIEEDNINYRNDLEYISKMLFKYLELKYSEKDIYIFRVYYLTSKSTYKKVSYLTKYHFTYISQIIKKIKMDLKSNFENYLKNNKI